MIQHVAKGQPARIVLLNHGDWTGRVESSLDDRIVVTTLARMPSELVGAGGDVTITTPRGILRAPCIVLAADRDGILELSLAGEHHFDQRRAHVRVGARVPGLVAPSGQSLRPLHTYTIDVSAGGLLIAGAGPAAEIGTQAEIVVKLPDRPPLRTIATVTRRTDEGHVALSFDRIDPADQETLVRWIFERQRIELSEARGRHA